MPGQQFLVNIIVYDDLNQSISSGIGSTVRKKDMIISENKAFSRLGPNGFQFVDRSVIPLSLVYPSLSLEIKIRHLPCLLAQLMWALRPLALLTSR